MLAQLGERCSAGTGGCAEHIDPGAHGRFTGFHEFSKLAAQPVSAHSRPIRATQGIANVGNRQGSVNKHGAGQGSGAMMCPLLANPEKGRPALDSADQALRR